MAVLAFWTYGWHISVNTTHLYTLCTTPTLVRHCTNVIQIFRICWDTAGRMRRFDRYNGNGVTDETSQQTPYVVLMLDQQANINTVLNTAIPSKHVALNQWSANVGPQSGPPSTQHWLNTSCLEAFTQCCFNVGPPSSTLAQHWNSIGWMPRVCWDVDDNSPVHHTLFYSTASPPTSGSSPHRKYMCATQNIHCFPDLQRSPRPISKTQ